MVQEDLPYLVLSYDPYLEAYNTRRARQRRAPVPGRDRRDPSASRFPTSRSSPWTPGEGSSGADDRLRPPGRRGRDRRVHHRHRRIPLRARPRPARDRAAGVKRARAPVNARWLIGKIGAALLTLVFVLVFNFFLFRAVGDPTDAARAAAAVDPGGDRGASCRVRARQAADGAVRRLRRRHAHPASWDQPAHARAGLGRDQGGDPVDAPAGRRRHPDRDDRGGLDGGEGRDETRASEPTTACSASTCSPTPHPSTGSGSS